MSFKLSDLIEENADSNIFSENFYCFFCQSNISKRNHQKIKIKDSNKVTFVHDISNHYILLNINIELQSIEYFRFCLLKNGIRYIYESDSVENCYKIVISKDSLHYHYDDYSKELFISPEICLEFNDSKSYLDAINKYLIFI